MNDLLLLMLWVAIGSAAGGVARCFVSGVVARALPPENWTA